MSEIALISKLEDCGMVTKDEYESTHELYNRTKANGSSVLSDADVDLILMYLQRDAPVSKFKLEDNLGLTGRIAYFCSYLNSFPATSSQKDKVLPVLRVAFHGPDSRFGNVKLAVFSYMRQNHETRFVPDALPFANDPNPRVQKGARAYLASVGYKL